MLGEDSGALNIIIGFVNVFQWLGITLLPVIQVSAHGKIVLSVLSDGCLLIPLEDLSEM